MQEAVPVGEGAMSAILGADADAVARACAEARAELAGRVVSPANLNAPGQVVDRRSRRCGRARGRTGEGRRRQARDSRSRSAHPFIAP